MYIKIEILCWAKLLQNEYERVFSRRADPTRAAVPSWLPNTSQTSLSDYLQFLKQPRAFYMNYPH